MASTLNEKIQTAAQLTIRSRIFYDLWWVCSERESRKKHIGAMREYSEFFRFTPHAYFVAFIIKISSLFEKKRGTVNFEALLKRLEKNCKQSDVLNKIREGLNNAEKKAESTRKLRSNLFAHRNAELSYDACFREAKITADDLRGLTEIALDLSNKMLEATGQDMAFFNNLPKISAERMLEALANCTQSDGQLPHNNY